MNIFKKKKQIYTANFGDYDNKQRVADKVFKLVAWISAELESCIPTKYFSPSHPHINLVPYIS